MTTLENIYRSHFMFAVESNDFYPVCKLNLEGFEDDYDQSNRLCAILFGSAYFRGKVLYPVKIRNNICFKETISFRTAEARKIASGKLFQERMLLGQASMIDPDESGTF